MRLPQAAGRSTKPLPAAPAEPKSPLRDFATTAAIAGPALALTWFILPLRLGEVLQIAGITRVAHMGIFDWVARMPGGAPLNFLTEAPFLAAFGNSRFSARIISFLFATASCYLFLRWVKRIPLPRPYWALAAFLLLPLHYMLATRGQPFEQALFFSLASTIWFFALVVRPSILKAIVYAALLTICIYTSRFSFLPAIGLLIALFVFIVQAQERRALWFVLPATAVPVVLFVPYLVWAQPHADAHWLFEPASFPAGTALVWQPLYALVDQGWAACGLAFLFLWGLGVAVWQVIVWRRPAKADHKPRWSAPLSIGKHRILVCCFGAVVSTIVLAMPLDAANGRNFAASQVLWIVPSLIVLTFAGFERAGRLLKSRLPLLAGATAVLVLSAAADIAYLASNPPDIGRVAKLVGPQLTDDSCVVFVSERYSKSLFLVFQPELADHECLNFFHRKIVLASHPYVRPDQQSDAESFFLGLNFVSTKRIHAGGGQIVVMQQRR